MRNFFKPEDFEIKIFTDFSVSNVRQKMCDVANKKINELIESWPVVYFGDPTCTVRYCTEKAMDTDTHKARLAFIEEINPEPFFKDNGDGTVTILKSGTYKFSNGKLEPIVKEPCKHEPNTLFIQTVNNCIPISEAHKLLEPSCKHCGVSLKATWSEKP